MFREAVMAFLGVKEEVKSGHKAQGLGEYCKGRDVETCRKYFGSALLRVCTTCPD